MTTITKLKITVNLKALTSKVVKILWREKNNADASLDLKLVRDIVTGMKNTGNPQSVKDLKVVLGDISLRNNHQLQDILLEMTPWITDNDARRPADIIIYGAGTVNCHVVEQNVTNQ